jgi:hypothetical protein
MKKLLFISMLGVFAVFSSCDEDEIVQTQVDFLFKETLCSNPWHDSSNYTDAEYLQVINDYLVTDLGVDYDDLNITEDGYYSGCEACHCLSGNIIRFSADEEFSEILLQNGFEIAE